MRHQGESSLLKSLAVAFGDGLAFGVGVKIAQTSARKRAAAVEPPLPAERNEPAEPLDLQVLSKVLAAIDARLAQSEQQIAVDLKAVEARQVQQSSQSQAALEEIHCSMMERVAAVEHSAQTVEQRLAAAIQMAAEVRLREYIDERVRAVETRLHDDITAAGDRTAKLLVETIDTRLLGRIELLEGEVRRQAETIRTLRDTADGSQKKLHEVLEGIGRACQEAIGELEKKQEGSGEGGSGPAAPAAEETSPADADDRRYDSLKLVNPPRAERKLPIPLVSSIAILLLGVAALGSHAIGF
jgi:hypothetical protein